MGELDGWRFCPRCGGSLARADDHLRCEKCGEPYWANSLPAVQGILERDGRVLLARRALAPHEGAWDIPGGFLSEAELPADGLRREFLEETGLHVEPVELLRIDLEPYEHRFVLSMTYIVRGGDGEPVADDDVAELRWFARDELPPMAFPNQGAVLADWAARDPQA